MNIDMKSPTLPPTSFSSLKLPSSLTPAAKFVGKTFPYSCALPCLVRDFYVLFTRVFLFSINNPYFDTTGNSLCTLIGNSIYQVKEIMTFELQKGEVLCLAEIAYHLLIRIPFRHKMTWKHQYRRPVKFPSMPLQSLRHSFTAGTSLHTLSLIFRSKSR